MYSTMAEWSQFISGLDMSDSAAFLFTRFMDPLANAYANKSKTLVGYFFSMIEDVLPVALTVAGAMLVVTLGWRLFRNFTRG